jgi:hypothetical protein
MNEVQNQELTSNNQSVWIMPQAGPPVPPDPTLIVSKIGENYAEVTGTCIVTLSDPALASGTLFIEQSIDGLTYDQADTFVVTDGGPEIAFSIRLLTRFVRARFDVGAAVEMRLRFGGLLKVAT